MKLMSKLVLPVLLVLPLISLSSVYFLNTSLSIETSRYADLNQGYIAAVSQGGMAIHAWNNLAF